ncbi:MAG: tape measure protein [Candidatus Sedimenticola sp. (ex Thyasira tokunagai)]
MSMRDLELSLVLSMVDRLSNPAKKAGMVTKVLAERLGKTRKEISEINKSAKKVKYLKGMNDKLGKTAQEADAAREKLAKLWKTKNAAEAAGKATKRYAQQIENTNKKIKKLSDRHKDLRGKTRDVDKELRKAGVDTRDLAKAQELLERKTKGLNRTLEKQKKRLAGVGRAADKVRRGMSKAKRLAGFGIGAGIAGGAALMPSVASAAEFDDYAVTLEVVEGSAKKARTAMAWVDNFAAKTPYALSGVTEAYVKLRTYGLEPTNGLLKDLGDTSAAMKKPLIQAVEAIADAIVGENERLKEFGIKAKVSGDTTTYGYTDKAGNQRSKSVNKNDRKAVEQALRSIWSEKFGGTMEKRSKRFSGIVSNLGDQWSRFQRMVMNSGPFQKLTEHLTTILAKIDEMAANGKLQEWAEKTGTKLVAIITGLKELAENIWGIIKATKAMLDPIAQMTGGWQNFAAILLTLKVAPVVGVFVGLAKTLAWLAPLLPIIKFGLGMVAGAIQLIGKALLMNPIGLTITAIAGAAYLIYKHWEPIKTFFSGLWDGVKAAFSSAWAWFASLPDKFANIGTLIIDGLKNKLLEKFKDLQAVMTKLGSYMPDWLRKKLDIHSPSRVMGKIGEQMSQGLGNGIQAGARAALPLAMAGGIATGAQAAPVPTVGAIHIHAAPGMNEEALANLVMQKIEQLQQQQAGSAMFDPA